MKEFLIEIFPLFLFVGLIIFIPKCPFLFRIRFLSIRLFSISVTTVRLSVPGHVIYRQFRLFIMTTFEGVMSFLSAEITEQFTYGLMVIILVILTRPLPRNSLVYVSEVVRSVSDPFSFTGC